MAAKLPPTPCDDSAYSDLQLMQMISRRNPLALELLFKRYARRGAYVAQRAGMDPDLAQEIAAEAFWRVWDQAEQFQPKRGSFSSWFFSIVHNLAVDELRRTRARANAQIRAYHASPRPPDHESQILQQLDALQIRNALNTLPETQRLPIHLAYVEGLTRREISERLRLPLGTIHTRVRLGKQRLKQLLQEQKDRIQLGRQHAEMYPL